MRKYGPSFGRTRRSHGLRSRIQGRVPRGMAVMPHFESIAAPCGCVDHSMGGVPCTWLYHRKSHSPFGVKRMTCGVCGLRFRYSAQWPWPSTKPCLKSRKKSV